MRTILPLPFLKDLSCNIEVNVKKKGGRQKSSAEYIKNAVLTWERPPQNCLKAPKQLISFVFSSSGVSINIL